MADQHQISEPPAFNAPAVVLGLVGALFGVHLLATFMDQAEANRLIAYFALSPARYAPLATGEVVPLPGGMLVDLAGFVTHIFLHADWGHLIFNSIWLLAFGTPVARRFGATRFLIFFLICGIIGGLTHVIIHAGELVFVVGASGAVSGLMGAAARFVFLAGGSARADHSAGPFIAGCAARAGDHPPGAERPSDTDFCRCMARPQPSIRSIRAFALRRNGLNCLGSAFRRLCGWSAAVRVL